MRGNFLAVSLFLLIVSFDQSYALRLGVVGNSEKSTTRNDSRSIQKFFILEHFHTSSRHFRVEFGVQFLERQAAQCGGPSVPRSAGTMLDYSSYVLFVHCFLRRYNVCVSAVPINISGECIQQQDPSRQIWILSYLAVSKRAGPCLSGLEARFST